MNNIDKLLRLNIEIEGLLRVLADRDSQEAKEALAVKYAELDAIMRAELAAVTDPHVADVKLQEAESAEVEPETEAAQQAIERGQHDDESAALAALAAQDCAGRECGEAANDDEVDFQQADRLAADEFDGIDLEDGAPAEVNDQDGVPAEGNSGAMDSDSAADTAHAQDEAEDNDEILTLDDLDVVSVQTGDDGNSVAENPADECDEAAELPQAEVSAEDAVNPAGDAVQDEHVKDEGGQTVGTGGKADDTHGQERGQDANAQAPIVNDVMGQRPGELRLDEALASRSARNLRKAFTLNDKFRFRRELFHNDDTAFAQTLDDIQKLDDYQQAETYVADVLHWDSSDEAVADFMSIVKSHFNSVNR